MSINLLSRLHFAATTFTQLYSLWRMTMAVADRRSKFDMRQRVFSSKNRIFRILAGRFFMSRLLCDLSYGHICGSIVCRKWSWRWKVTHNSPTSAKILRTINDRNQFNFDNVTRISAYAVLPPILQIFIITNNQEESDSDLLTNIPVSFCNNWWNRLCNVIIALKSLLPRLSTEIYGWRNRLIYG